jgi:hypothetical protein
VKLGLRALPFDQTIIPSLPSYAQKFLPHQVQGRFPDPFLALHLLGRDPRAATDGNLQRADLDPIDTARAMVGYFQVRHAEEGLDAEGIINAMILLKREPDRVKTEFADTVSAIQKISGKSL